MSLLHPQRGVALITAVLVVALAVIAAVSVLDAGHFSVQRASTLQDSVRAWGYAAGAEDWARTILERDAKNNQHDSLDEIWAEPQSLPTENGGISGEIIDALSRFNLNNLGLADNQDALPGFQAQDGVPVTEYLRQVRIFESMIRQLADASELIPNPRELADSIRDWIDEDQFPTGNGREDGDYLGMEPPHRAANRPMSSVTELKSILQALYGDRDNLAGKIYALLLPQVTVLPVDGVTPLNINTVTAELLMSLDSTGNNTTLATFAEERLQQPVESQADITTRLQLAAQDADPVVISFKTNLFQLRLQAVDGDGRVALYSLLLRPGSGNVVTVTRSTDTE